MIQEKILGDIKTAIKARDAARLEVLRGVKTAFVNELVATKRTPQDQLSDEEAIGVLMRLAKQRRESIEQFTRGGRPELADKETRELAVLEEYLPQLMSREEIRAAVQAKMDELGVAGAAQMGMLMGATMQELKGKADGKLVKEVVQDLLA
jgi:uncharacterized protein YqeY